MSLGHWFVIGMDWVFFAITLVSVFTMRKHDSSGIKFAIFLLMLILFNIAAICVR